MDLVVCVVCVISKQYFSHHISQKNTKDAINLSYNNVSVIFKWYLWIFNRIEYFRRKSMATRKNIINI